MKSIIITFICLGLLAQNTAAQAPNYCSYEKKSFAFSQNNLDSFLFYNLKAIDYYVAQKENKNLARALQNRGFKYEEGKNNYLAAIAYTQAAFEIYVSEKDTLSMANLLKYIGLMYAKINLLEIGKSKVDTAIALFTQKKYYSGVAVSEYDLAQIFIIEKNYTQAETLLLKAKAHWQSINDSCRIFGINTELLMLYRIKNDKPKFDNIVSENEKLLINGGIFPILVKAFEKVKMW